VCCFGLIAFLVAGLDLVSKWWAFKYIKPDEAVAVIPNFLYFRLTKNIGAVFGIGRGQVWFFILATLVALIFISQLFMQSRARQRVLHFFLALTFGGAIGNLYDRIAYGFVRDFIHTQIVAGGKELWPWIFNVADVALVVGVSGLLLGWMTGKFEIGGTCPVARPVTQEDLCDTSESE
jgi:signal peptidase II